MLRQLTELERMNRADSVMQNDTLAEALTRYFDRHGSANERMRAHYILGRTYADMGEAPAALNAYLDAADCADTTATDCDYHTLSRVYGQMADVFYYQNLLDDCTAAYDRSICFAWKDKDTLQALNSYAHKILAFHKKQQGDSVIIMFEDLYAQLLSSQGLQTVSSYCTLPITSLIKRNELGKARHYLDIYESQSGYFDSLGNIKKGMEAYYYYKGDYYTACKEYDSAEYYYRKELLYGIDAMNQNMAARGLSLMYDKMGCPDSAAKYALYSYEMNDSVYAQMAIKEVEQAKASYNYSRNQILAEKEGRRAEREGKKAERNLYIIIVITLLGGYAIYHQYRQKSIREKEYQAKELELEHSMREILILRSQAEKLTELIASKDDAITQRTEELEELSSNEAQLRQMIAEKELSLERLQTELKDFHKLVRTSQAELEKSPVFSNLHKKADAGKKLSEDDFSELYRLVREVLPGFYQFISNKKYSLNEAEYNTCVLFRLHVKAFSAGALLGKSPAAITKISKSVMMKLFHENGNSRELIEKLQGICE